MTRRCIRIVCGLLLAGLPLAASAELVGLSLHAPSAQEVHVSGSFDPYWQKRYPMKKNAAGHWTAVLDVPPGRYEYQFLIDSQWRHDPSLPKVADAFGGWNNVLIVLPRDDR